MRTALVVIDMQRFFSEMVTPRMMENIAALVNYFRRHGGAGETGGSGKSANDGPPPLIIFTQHGHPEEELIGAEKSPSQLVKKWGVGASIRAGSKDWKFMPGIQLLIGSESGSAVDVQVNSGNHEKEPDAEERKRNDHAAAASNTITILPKNTYDGFLNTRLEELLRQGNVERVVCCGVMTDCCVDTTARGAFNRGFETWVVQDACGSANRAQHERGLGAFEFAFGDVISTDEVIRRLENERERKS